MLAVQITFNEKKPNEETSALKRKINSKQHCQNSQDLFNNKAKFRYSFQTWFCND